MLSIFNVVAGDRLPGLPSATFFLCGCSFWAACYVIIGVKAQDTFGETLQHYRGLLFTLCRRFSGHGVEVDDLMQEVALTLWRQRERLLSLPRGPQQAAWVWRVARNTAIDTLRRYHPHESLPDDVDPPADDNGLVEALYDQIALLGEPDRTLVTLHLQGYNYEEIGERLQMSEKNVSVRLVRIKEKLRKAMTI